VSHTSNGRDRRDPGRVVNIYGRGEGGRDEEKRKKTIVVR